MPVQHPSAIIVSARTGRGRGQIQSSDQTKDSPSLRVAIQPVDGRRVIQAISRVTRPVCLADEFKAYQFCCLYSRS